MYNALPSYDEDSPAFQAPGTPAPHNAPNTGIDIDAWTIAALQSLNVSPAARGIGSPLAIPIDQRIVRTPVKDAQPKAVKFDGNRSPSPPTPPRRPTSRRDSMVKREALLKGKEGSRQRRRWENSAFLPFLW